MSSILPPGAAWAAGAGGAPPAAAADPSYPHYEGRINDSDSSNSQCLKTTISLQERMLREALYAENNNPIKDILLERIVAVDMEELTTVVQDICAKILDNIESKAEKTFPTLKTDREIDPIIRYDRIHQRVIQSVSVYFDIDPSHYSLSNLIDMVEDNREPMLVSFLKQELNEKPRLAKEMLKTPDADNLALKDFHISKVLGFVMGLDDFGVLCKHKQFEIICTLLNSPDISDDDRRSCGVRMAAEHGHIGIVKDLLNDGEIPDDDRGHSFEKAAEYGHIEIVRMLLHGRISGDKRGYAFRTAAQLGYIEIVRLLNNDEEITDYDRIYALGMTARNGHIEIVRLFLNGTISDDAKEFAIQQAEENGHYKIVKLLNTEQ